MRIRILLTIVLLVVIVSVIALALFTRNTRNAPLTLNQGQAEATEDVVADSASGDIPLGVSPSTLMFLSDVNGDWDVMTLAADGTLTALTADESGAQDMFASYALDGSVINFISNRIDETAMGPSQVGADGSGLRNLTIIGAVMTLVGEAQFDWDPLWSPDGETLAWVSLRDFNLEIYTVPITETINFDDATRRTRGSARDWYMSWSPDGTQFVYNGDAEGNENVYLHDLVTSESTLLTDNPADDLHPFWSLDGDSLYFVSERENIMADGFIDIYQMDLNGSNQRPIDDSVTIQADPAWSPTGQHMAFMSNETGTWQIYVQQTDGTNLRRVTDGDGNFMFPVWMP